MLLLIYARKQMGTYFWTHVLLETFNNVKQQVIFIAHNDVLFVLT